MTIEVAPLTLGLRETAIANHWFRDEERNAFMGWGRGDVGILHATEAFRRMLQRADTDENYVAYGVYGGIEPVGYYGLEFLGPRTRTVRMEPFFVEDSEEVIHSSLQQVLHHVFTAMGRKIHRVETELLMESPWVKLFRDFGFTQEGIKKSAVWIGTSARQTVPLRLLAEDAVRLRILRPDWARMQEN